MRNSIPKKNKNTTAAIAIGASSLQHRTKRRRTIIVVALAGVYILLLLLVICTNRSYGYTSQTVFDSADGAATTEAFTLGPAGTTAWQLIPALNSQPQEIDIYANPDMEYVRGMMYFDLYDEENNVLLHRQLGISDHNESDWMYRISLSSIEDTDLSNRPLFFTISTTSDSPYQPLLCARSSSSSESVFSGQQTLRLNDDLQDFCIYYTVKGVAEANNLLTVKIKLLTYLFLAAAAILICAWSRKRS